MNQIMELEWIRPQWPAPPRVRALTTTRGGGVSRSAFSSLNLGAHVGDDAGAVAENRRRLCQQAGLPEMPRWLQQEHGIRVVRADDTREPVVADAAYTTRPGVVCAVLTADCLPLLLCDGRGERVAAVHAGWRGLAGGVIEAAVAALTVDPAELLAWLGPAIGPTAFEVGPEVRAQYLAADAAAGAAFRAGTGDRWYADLYHLARQRLQRLGIVSIHGGHYCTYIESGRFFSFRRDGETGRMATLIWLERDAG